MVRSSKAVRQRGEPLVARVLESTLAELARVGYEHLSVEEIAANAEVNKTTIYRRWATVDELVLSAIESAGHPAGLPDTGSLRQDLIAYLHAFREVCRSPVLCSLARMQFIGGFGGKLDALVKRRVNQTQCNALVLFERAIRRGEIAPSTDIELLRDLFLGGVQSLILLQMQELSDERADRLVSFFLSGAADCAARKKPKRSSLLEQ